jgi:hypothetical protein
MREFANTLQEKRPTPVVFVGHGRSTQWRDLKDHLHDKHGYKVEAYETGARAGHSIRDILEEMADKSSFTLLVMTAEDEQSDGGTRARQNVVHEAGIFQGRLGFPRAVLLLEEGAEEFSNVQGVQFIRFSKNNIKETFGEVLATLRREFHDESWPVYRADQQGQAVAVRLPQTSDMAFPVNSAHPSLCSAAKPKPDAAGGTRRSLVVATREGCATVAHADIRGLGTSRPMCVAGLPRSRD